MKIFLSKKMEEGRGIYPTPSIIKKKVKAIEASSRQKMSQKIFWAFIGVFSVLIIFSSLTIGIPSDEPIDDAYGQAALKYYTSLGKDTSFSNLEVYGKKFNLQKYYGAGFELTATAISSVASGSQRFHIRHVLVAICGIMILVFTGLLCKELTGWESACFAVLMLSATPTIAGNMLFNSKDIPFAMGYIITLYYLIKSSNNFPKINMLDVVGIVLGIAITVSIRIGGVLLGVYIFVFLGLKVLFEKGFRKDIFNKKLRNQIKIVCFLFLIVITGCLLGLLFYPNFWEHPIQHISEALKVASDFPAKIMMLFEGKMIYSTSLPPYYLLKSLGITLPVFILILTPLLLVFIPKIIKIIGTTNLIFLFLTCLFPIAFVIFKESPIYNGWRHILFFYPPLVILVSIVLKLIIIPFKHSTFQYLAIIFFAYFVLKIFIWQIPNHTYQYTYYNEFAGCFEKAYEDYDNDYQQLAVTNGVKWLLKNEKVFQEKERKKIRIASNNANALNFYFDTAALKVQFINTGIKKWKDFDWDYAVVSTIFLQPKVRDFVFPPKDLIYSEKIGGQGIAYVVKRKNKNDFLGLSALRRKQYNQAIPLLLQAYQYDPNNFNVWLNLGYAFASIRNGDEVIKYITKYIQIFPNSWQANQLLGLGHLYKLDYANSENFLQRAISLNPKEKSLYQNLITLYSQSNRFDKVKSIQQKLDKFNMINR